MLSSTQSRAVELLFEFTDAEVAAKLRIKRETLEAWKQNPEFVQAVQERLKENRQAAVRILSRVYLNACREIEALVRSDDDKNKHKVIVDILKASGLLKELGAEETDYVDTLLQRLADEHDEEED
jgi:myo-inositol-1-phosphate synthase